jgi:hypothetical protein
LAALSLVTFFVQAKKVTKGKNAGKRKNWTFRKDLKPATFYFKRFLFPPGASSCRLPLAA